MRDEELLKVARRIVAGVLNDCDPSGREGIAEEVVEDLRAIAAAARAQGAEEEREACALEWDEDATRLTSRATRAAQVGKRMLSNRLNGEARRAKSVADSIRSRAATSVKTP